MMATLTFRIIWFLYKNKTKKKSQEILSRNSSLNLSSRIKPHLLYMYKAAGMKQKAGTLRWWVLCAERIIVLHLEFKKCANVSPSCKVLCQHRSHVAPEVPWYNRIPTGNLSSACHFCVWYAAYILCAGMFPSLLIEALPPAHSHPLPHPHPTCFLKALLPYGAALFNGIGHWSWWEIVL
jgi:hypothetical protein